MNRTGKRRKDESTTLFDRLACGAFSGVVGIVAGSFIWLAICVYIEQPIPYDPVLWISGVTFLVGFLATPEFASEILAKVINGIIQAVGGD